MEFVTHDEAILVEIRPTRLPQFQLAKQLAKQVECLAFVFDRFAQCPRAFAIEPFATGLRPSPRQQRRRGMNPLSPARTPSASVPPAGMSHDPSDPDFFPPPPKQPLPPGKQPTGPMPDQDPPGGPHHLPEDPVAVPEEGDLLGRLGWSPRALADAALRARIPS
ncbi:MAG TPA: hypothetical protein VFP88_03535 [Rhodanobacteraceae bacterium]|nr:hypothetical protein [Rhodanobacteraceae bacterium]